MLRNQIVSKDHNDMNSEIDLKDSFTLEELEWFIGYNRVKGTNLKLKKYQKRLEELNSVEADKKTPEWESEIATVRSNVKSIGGKIGARKKVVNKAPDEKTLTAAQKTVAAE
jgi:hypothetical protein